MKYKLQKPILFFFVLLASTAAKADVVRKKYSANNKYLKAEILKENVFHFELAHGAGPEENKPIYTSPMVFNKSYPGASSASVVANKLETAQLSVEVDVQSLCLSITERTSNTFLTRICPSQLKNDDNTLTITKEQSENVYGLGQQFIRENYGKSNGDWISHEKRTHGYPEGNGFEGFGRVGTMGNVQIPVFYALGKKQSYLLFLDNVYRHDWAFKASPWSVNMGGDQVRFYVISGPSLLELRKEFMKLVGTPPVPPRKAFGLWVSQFGFESWIEIDEKKDTLRKNSFPVDGFVLDLQWFGGFAEKNPNSRMGSLDWADPSIEPINPQVRSNFPEPEANIKRLASEHIGLIAIEESYVGENLPSFTDLKKIDGLAKSCEDSKPLIMTNWFGVSGLIAWSNKIAAAFWHDNKRFLNLIKKGILGHWTDLGEPESYDPKACYAGELEPGKNKHKDIHNLYSLLWNESIYDGYVRHHDEVNRRPFILSRSGTAGIQRFGSGMWSGDIGAEMGSLTTQFNSQLHMSFSGIDYYGSDVGGFHRGGLDANLHNELYTQWFANSSWIDIPLRPHTNNFNSRPESYFETAPDRVGRLESNRANLRRRYELIPYYYSLAHRAFLEGEPVIPPAVFYEQNDPVLRERGDHKFIGKDILVATVSKHGAYKQDIYLPKGNWINYYTNEWIKSSGIWIKDLPVYRDQVFDLPAFVRAGAIIPMMYVDGNTLDAFGHRSDSSLKDDLIVRVFPSASGNSFTLYEDDGSTLNFDKDNRPFYNVRTTKISQMEILDKVVVSISGAVHKTKVHFENENKERNNIVQLVTDNSEAIGVMLNGAALTQLATLEEFNSAESGWVNQASVILAKSGKKKIGSVGKFIFELQPKKASGRTSLYFVCKNGSLNPKNTVFVTGNIPELAQPKKIDPNVKWDDSNFMKLPIWTGIIEDLPADTKITWNCITHNVDGTVKSSNASQITTKSAAYSGATESVF